MSGVIRMSDFKIWLLTFLLSWGISSLCILVTLWLLGRL